MAYSHILSTSIEQVSIAKHIVMRCQLLIPHYVCITQFLVQRLYLLLTQCLWVTVNIQPLHSVNQRSLLCAV